MKHRLRQFGFLPRYVPCALEQSFVRSTGRNFLLPDSVDRQAIPSIADEYDGLKSSHQRMCRLDRARQRYFLTMVSVCAGGGCRRAKSISSTISKTTEIAGHNSERHLSTSSTAAAPTATTAPSGISRYLSLKCRSRLASYALLDNDLWDNSSPDTSRLKGIQAKMGSWRLASLWKPRPSRMWNICFKQGEIHVCQRQRPSGQQAEGSR